MSRRKPSWYFLTIKALLFAGLLYKFSRFFMKSALKQAARPEVKKSKKSMWPA